MSLKKRIEADFITAFKAKEMEKKNTLGMVKSAITEAEKKNGKELTDDEVISVVQGYVKKLDQTIAQVPVGSDLALSSEKEKEYVSIYMPTMLTDEEIETQVRSVFEDILGPAKGMMGAAMKYMKENFNGRYDGKKLKEIVDKLLAP